MNNITVDAQIFKNYFEESVLGLACCLTKSCVTIFEDYPRNHILVFDQQGMIKQEWESGIDRDWFNVWFADALRSGKATEIDTNKCRETCKKLRTLGFPTSGRDIWYIKVAKTHNETRGQCYIISEDLDFYDPVNKLRLDARRRILTIKSKRSPIRKYLRQQECIEVLCVEEYLHT